jgi:2'-5' RNA ligase
VRQHRYFFALQPPPLATDEIVRLTEALRRRRRGLGAPMGRGRHHVSLVSLGVDDRPLDAWSRRAAAAVTAVRRPAFRLAFNRIAAFAGGGGKRALVLRGDEGVLGVDLLRADIQAALCAAGLARRREQPFEAHLTLVRGPDDAPETFIAPISWVAREFVLIHSYVGEGRYEIAGRFPLTGS